MNKRLCVYTCITGDYDNLPKIKNVEKNIDYLCFTNNPKLKSNTWQIVRIENEGLDNQRLSRKIKMLGHPIISKNYDISVWMDASVVWDKKISDFVKTYFKNTSFAAFRHSQRTTVRAEAATCLISRKDTKENLLRTIEFLDSRGFRDDLGLYEMTVFIKNHNDPKVIETMKIWFNMVRKYSKRDQLSFTYAIWQTHLEVSAIRLSVWNNPWFHNVKHTIQPKIQNCHLYYGDPDKDFDFDKYYIYNYRQNNDIYQFNTNIPYDTDQIEINLCEFIGINYEQLDISPHPDRILNLGFFRLFNTYVSCTNHSAIRIYGDFKAHQKLFFSVKMCLPQDSTFSEVIERQWSVNSQLSRQNHNLNIELNKITDDLHRIINSRSWKFLEKLRKLRFSKN